LPSIILVLIFDNVKILIMPVFFKENVAYPVWTCRDPISLILGIRFSLIIGTRW